MHSAVQNAAEAVAGGAVSAADAARAFALPDVTQGPWWVALIPFLPLLGAVLCGLCAAFKIKSKLPAWITVALLATSFAITVAMFQQLSGGASISHAFRWIEFRWGPEADQVFTANFSFYADNLSILWMLFVTGLATLIALYASEYMSHDVGTGYCRFFAAFCLFVFSMSCLVLGDNLILLFLGWEGVGLCSYLLIGYYYKKPSAVAAAKKAFIMNRIGDLGLLMGIFLTFVHFGTVEYRELFALAEPYVRALEAGRIGDIPAIVNLIPVLLAIGAFGKSAQFPLYVWLPDAMEGPTPVSALIHAATMVTAGVYLIARTYPLFLASEIALPLVAWVGAITALLAATIGMAQFDIKRIMAYSTVSQLGFMFCGLAVLTTVGGVFHVLTHAFFKATLFLACGAVMHGFAGQLDLRKLSGVMFMPGWLIVGLAMLVGCLNLAGFPFTAGYFSKDMILAEAFITPTMAPIGWILLITAGLTAYYTFRVFFRVFVGPKEYHPGDDLHGEEETDVKHHSEQVEQGDPQAEAVGEKAHGVGQEAHRADQAEEHHHGHGHFHPHPPGWAINTVLATLAIASILAAGLYFIGDKGWVDGMLKSSTAQQVYLTQEGTRVSGYALVTAEPAAKGTFFGFDPHKAMYFVSAVVGLIGIAVAFVLHYLGRTEAATSKADALVPKLGPIATWAQDKWRVDELYELVFVKPLRVISHIFHVIDKLLIDGLVNLFGVLPRIIGSALRPAQSGQLQGYAVGMAAGVAFILLVVVLMAVAGAGVPS